MKRQSVAITATAGAATGVLGLTVLSLPAGAGPDPKLPPVAPEQLVESVMTAGPPAMRGTVEVDNALGLPAIPGAGDASELLSDGTSTFRVWTDGQGRQRVSIPSERGETTVINDGESTWKWDSSRRTATHVPSHHGEAGHQGKAGHQGERQGNGWPQEDPADAARHIVGQLRQNSAVAVDGTAKVAGRDAYELVLTPKPTESTVLREVRIAVDAQERMPLALTVNTQGSDSPALRVAYSELDLSRPEARLFQFTPPAGTEVTEPKGHQRQSGHPPATKPKVVGSGWDSVLVAEVSQKGEGESAQQNPTAIAKQVGERVSGPWGEGWIMRTEAGAALVTSDGRVAVGAVPEQVLTSAIANAAGTPR